MRTTPQSKIIGLCYKTESRKPMAVISKANVTTEQGVENDAAGNFGKRQVTVLSVEQWLEACAEAGKPIIDWTERKANILVNNIKFNESYIGKKIQVGDLILEITGETTPCRKMNFVCEGLEEAMKPDWRGGVTCKVIQSGKVQTGDNILIV